MCLSEGYANPCLCLCVFVLVQVFHSWNQFPFDTQHKTKIRLKCNVNSLINDEISSCCSIAENEVFLLLFGNI